MNQQWKSDVLRCFVDDEHCEICRFIAGDRSEAVMMKVIETLDRELAAERSLSKLWFRCMEKAIEKT